MENNCIEQLDENYKPGKKYSDADMLALGEHWKKLYDEFYSLRNNKNGKYLMDKNYELRRISLMLAMLYDFENRIVLLINMSNMKELQDFIIKRNCEVINDFKAVYPKVKISSFAEPVEVLKIIQSVIKSQTNIFDEKSGVVEKQVEKQIETVHSITSQMGTILGFNLNINTMTCLEFIGHERTVEKKNAQNNDSSKLKK